MLMKLGRPPMDNNAANEANRAEYMLGGGMRTNESKVSMATHNFLLSRTSANMLACN